VKILRLDLTAYGPFTGARLDLNGGRQGLHIVYGPNEAGKSSALRALRHLLYGIPDRTTDAFLHPFPKMRVGGVLCSAAGEVLEVVRRKGRLNTLKAADDDAPVEEAALQRLLNGVDAGLFATMFGIGYEDLVAGGREIVQGGGDLGRLIFAAGSGAANLGAVFTDLQAEADALFRPAGQKQKINEAVGRLKQRRAEIKAALLPAPEWERHELALAEAHGRKAAVEDNLAAAQRKLSRLKRIGEAQPLIAGRRETLNALEALAGAVRLTDGFAERRAAAQTRLRLAEGERDQTLAALAGLRGALAELVDPAVLLGHAELIEEIHQDLGSRRKAARDRIGLETRRNTQRAEARRVIGDLREGLTLEEAERLRIKKAEAVRIQDLGAEYERIATRLEGGREKIPELTRQKAAMEARLAAMPEPRPIVALKAALAETEEALSAEKHLKTLRDETQALVHACAQAQARLGLPVVPLVEVGRVPVPVAETVQRFEGRFEDLERRAALIAEERRKTEAGLSETERRLEEVRREREVPTEEDLMAARALRDGGWRLIALRLDGAEAPEAEMQAFLQALPGETSLRIAFEASIAGADALADRLRREADRVAVKARLLADQTGFRQQAERLGQELSAVQVEKKAVEADWVATWGPVGVAVRSPREMRQWLQDFRALAEKASEALKRTFQCETLQAEVDRARAGLTRSFEPMAEPPPGAGESLSSVAKRAWKTAETEEGMARRRAELDRERSRVDGELESARDRLKATEGDLRRWQGQWELALRPLGLEADARPAQAAAVMEELKALFDRLREAEVLQQRLEGIDRDAEAFTAKVKALAEAVAADLAARPAEEATLELQRRLTAGREARSRRQTLQKQVEQAEVTLKKAETAMAEAASLLAAMCAEAGCAGIEGLPEAERRSALRLRLEARLAEGNERLRQLGGGAAVAEFVIEAGSVDPDGIAGDMGRLKAEIAALSAERSGLDQAIGRETAELGRMDGGDRAAAVAEDIQAILGGLETDVGHYARLKIAARVLAMAIERFRERSQGPILRKASGFFGRITCGAFEGIRADHDPDGKPVLVGVRPGGGGTVPVGGMSEGTADQLYLSLRLAGLEDYLDANEAMPFIVDDILVKFDDERAAAALEVLAELSEKTQVVFFTHHRHLVAIAEARLPAARLTTHTLG
jgi:uncharacterized protein YhaN